MMSSPSTAESSSAEISRSKAALGTVSRLGIGTVLALMKKARLLSKGEMTLSEVMESDATYNARVDRSPAEPVAVSLSVAGASSIARLLDPSDADGFLTWFFQSGTHVTISGLADRAACQNGHLRVQLFSAIHYYYEFVGDDGEVYHFCGAKDLTDPNRLRGSRTLYGGVYSTRSNEKIIESTTFFGKDQYLLELARFLASMGIS